MAVLFTLGLGLAVLWLRLPFASVAGALAFIVAVFLIRRSQTRAFWGPQLFFAAALLAFAYRSAFSFLSFVMAAFGLALIALFADSDEAGLAPSRLMRVRPMLFGGVVVWGMAALHFVSLYSATQTLAAGLVLAAAAGYGAAKIVFTEDALSGRASARTILVLYGLLASFFAAELFFVFLFLPFSPNVSAVLFGISLWVFFEVMVSARFSPFLLGRTLRAGLVGSIAWIALVLTAPWPSGVIR